MHTKDFDIWNERKKATHALKKYLPLYHERQVRWCRLGVNVGFEQDGAEQEFSRPVLILKGFSRNTCLIVPLTTSKKKNSYRVPLGMVGGKEASAVISQLRLVDTRRLDTLIDTMDEKMFEKIRKTVRALF